MMTMMQTKLDLVQNHHPRVHPAMLLPMAVPLLVDLIPQAVRLRAHQHAVAPAARAT